jgi:hypothetical protein
MSVSQITTTRLLSLVTNDYTDLLDYRYGSGMLLLLVLVGSREIVSTSRKNDMNEESVASHRRRREVLAPRWSFRLYRSGTQTVFITVTQSILLFTGTRTSYDRRRDRLA